MVPFQGRQTTTVIERVRTDTVVIAARLPVQRKTPTERQAKIGQTAKSGTSSAYNVTRSGDARSSMRVARQLDGRDQYSSSGPGCGRPPGWIGCPAAGGADGYGDP
ncbi:hypothetical protein Adi01nite_45890 [Amorphoplanes digitatis]|nr:hypothetical protein Adi01nite_45890 [Actinoplanes digitatis]